MCSNVELFGVVQQQHCAQGKFLSGTIKSPVNIRLKHGDLIMISLLFLVASHIYCLSTGQMRGVLHLVNPFGCLALPLCTEELLLPA